MPMDLMSQLRALRQLSANPYAKPDSTEAEAPLPISVIPPALHITGLTRLDQSKVSDPRRPGDRNQFVASHHTYGKIYTTSRIDHDTLRQIGDEQRGESIGAGGGMAVMRGQLRMAQADVGWRRKRKADAVVAAAEARQDETKAEERLYFVGDSDLEYEDDGRDARSEDDDGDVDDQGRPPTSRIGAQPHFDTPPGLEAVEQAQIMARVPERSPLMLLRFFRSSDELGERIAPVKRKVEVSDEAPLQVKKKVVKKVFQARDNILPDLASPPPLLKSVPSTKRSQHPDASGIQPAHSQFAQTTGVKHPGPAGIVSRKR